MLAGFGAGLTFAPLTSAAMGSVAGGRAGVGAGVFNTARQIGFTLGLAVLVAVFVGVLPSRVVTAQEEAATLVGQSDLPAPAKEGIIEGMLSAPAEQAGQAARSGERQTFDLYERLRETAGPELADRLRPTLDELSQELQGVFARNVAGAFGRSFLVGAIILWLGVLPALFVTRGVGRERPEAGGAPTRGSFD
jgi:hypothetical protein